jgi:hypothetical protein
VTRGVPKCSDSSAILKVNKGVAEEELSSSFATENVHGYWLSCQSVGIDQGVIFGLPVFLHARQ